MHLLLSLLSLAAIAHAENPPHSSHKLRLASRKLSAASGIARRASAANLPLLDYFNGTDLQWYGNISIGTPPQTLSVVFDTGSFVLVTASTRCGAPCANQTAFNPAASTSFTDTSDGKTSTIVFSTGAGVTPVVGNDTSLTIAAANDTVAIAGLTGPRVAFFLITDQTPNFAPDPFSGIMGMPPSATGFMASVIEQGLPGIFSLSLAAHDVGNAEITFGGADSAKINGSSTLYAPLISKAQQWTIASSAIYVNGQTNSMLRQSRNMLLDSGTSNMVFDPSTTAAIYALISSTIVPGPISGTFGVPCASVPSLPATIDIELTGENGAPFNVTIPTSELSVGPFATHNDTCQTLFNALDLNGVQIVGASLLKHYYTTWDVQQRRVGFVAPQTAPSTESKPANGGTRRLSNLLVLAWMACGVLYAGV